MSIITSLPSQTLAEITSLLDVFGLFNLYATGDLKLRLLKGNGGVTNIKLASADGGSIGTMWKSGISQPPNFWHLFKHIRHIQFGNGTPDQVSIPKHLLANLLSIKIVMNARKHLWGTILEQAKEMNSLQHLRYDVDCILQEHPSNKDNKNLLEYHISPIRVPMEDPVSPIVLPVSLKMTLTSLVIGFPSVYNLADLPPFLTEFNACGKIEQISVFDFDRGDDDKRAQSERGTFLVPSDIPDTVDAPLPATLVSFYFRFMSLRKNSHVAKTDAFSILPLCNALPPSLLHLNIQGVLNRKTYHGDFMHLLPRSLHLLSLHIPLMCTQVSFASLPPRLTSLDCDIVLNPNDAYLVSLPVCLTSILFKDPVDLSMWLPYIEFPNPNLSIGRILLPNPVTQTYFEHKSFTTDMILSFSRNRGAVTVAKWGHGLRSVRFDAREHNGDMSFLLSNVLKSCARLQFLEIISRASSQVDLSNIDLVFPSTITDLLLTGYCSSIENLDLANMLPQLQSFTYCSRDVDGGQNAGHWFRPATLPPIKKLEIRYYYVIDLRWLLSALSSNIESCFLTGNKIELNCDDNEINSIIPSHLGCNSASGWSLYLGCVHHTPTACNSAKITDVDSFCDAMLKQNRHLLTLEFKFPEEAPNDYKFVSNFKRRSQ